VDFWDLRTHWIRKVSTDTSENVWNEIRLKIPFVVCGYDCNSLLVTDRPTNIYIYIYIYIYIIIDIIKRLGLANIKGTWAFYIKEAFLRASKARPSGALVIFGGSSGLHSATLVQNRCQQ
jgi:hypothetical protein